MRWTDDTISNATLARIPTPNHILAAIDHVHRLLTDESSSPPTTWDRKQIERLIWLRWRVDHRFISEDLLPVGAVSAESYQHIQGCG